MSTDNKHITITYPDQTTANHVVDLLVRKRPEGWSRKSLATYYREEYAEKLRPALDNMIETGIKKVVRVDRLSLQSCYLWVNQAWKFIRDYMDGPNSGNGKYSKLWKETKCSRVKGAGVIIEFRNTVNEELIAEDFIAEGGRIAWKKQIDEYLEDKTNIRPFHKDNLLLSTDEQYQLRSELEDLGNIQFSISAKEIKIIKTI